MELDTEKILFNDRYDAGRQLAQQLAEYKGKPVLVLAIPNGGIPMGLELARALDADLDVVIVRKLPLPLNPEAGFGAVADDGSVMLNDDLVAKTGLTKEQINAQVTKVRGDIRQRSLLYRKDKPPALARDKVVIITDDGMASGFTMKAAVESVRHRRPREIIVAVPVASAVAMEQIKPVADKIVTVAVGTKPRFAVAGFYRHWHDLNDKEVVNALEEFRAERFWAGNKR
ncbi:MAG: phosphoribosyltransferase family protein [Dehalococcoidales bacterium]|nr:phosphoribosyltransferase family protein [Dehalococcoidales bacterium]